MKRLVARPGEAAAFIEKAARYRGNECLIWPFGQTGRGYGNFADGGKKGRTRAAHAAVCERVYGPAPDKHEAAHSCGVRLCVNPDHLRWDTRKGNLADTLEHGTRWRGERHGANKLTEQDVLAIRASTATCFDLAAQYGISFQHAQAVRTGKEWSWLE